jgi:hypothetical protein
MFERTNIHSNRPYEYRFVTLSISYLDTNFTQPSPSQPTSSLYSPFHLYGNCSSTAAPRYH